MKGSGQGNSEAGNNMWIKGDKKLSLVKSVVEDPKYSLVKEACKYE